MIAGNVDDDPELQRLRAELRALTWQWWSMTAGIITILVFAIAVLALVFWPVPSRAQAATGIGQCAGPDTVPFRTKPWIRVWDGRSENGRYAWCYVKNPDPTLRPKLVYLVCKHGVCDLGLAAGVLDEVKRAGPIADLPARLATAAERYMTKGGCYGNDVTGAIIVDPWRINPTTNAREPDTDPQFRAACAEALPVFLDDWPPALVSPPPPPPPPPAVWKVKAPGPRVVYTVVNGRRGPLTSPTKYVAVGAPCDESVRIEERIGTLVTIYMGVTVDGVTGIAVCAP